MSFLYFLAFSPSLQPFSFLDLTLLSSVSVSRTVWWVYLGMASSSVQEMIGLKLVASRKASGCIWVDQRSFSMFQNSVASWLKVRPHNSKWLLKCSKICPNSPRKGPKDTRLCKSFASFERIEELGLFQFLKWILVQKICFHVIKWRKKC